VSHIGPELLVLFYGQGGFIEFPFPPPDFFFQEASYHLAALASRNHGLHPGI